MRTPVVVAAGVTVALLALPAGAAPPPQQQIAQLKRQVAALKTQVSSCVSRGLISNSTLESAWRRELALRRYAAHQGACGVTQPNGSQPPDGNIGGALIHGNGSLWVRDATVERRRHRAECRRDDPDEVPVVA